MKLNIFFILSLVISFTFTACDADDDVGKSSEQANENRNIVTTNPDVARLEFPHLKDGNSIVIVHRTNDSYGLNYSVEWDCDKKSQRWSCYQMYVGYGGTVGRYEPASGELQYPFDPQLDAANYFDKDYFYGSGFDHGHICPSADRQYSKEANKQTFYLTNMQPQYNNFNAKLWAKMEAKVRSWTPTRTSDTLFVCKGGTIDNEEYILKRINDKLIVPKFFYMALLLKNSQGYRAIAFWAENENVDRESDNLVNYVISIDELETRTGIDFFCNLPDKVEDAVESLCIPASWGLQ